MLLPYDKVGVTATKKGLTAPQLERVRKVITELRATEGHHGDCVGGDSQLHDVMESLPLHIVIHPPDNPHLRAFRKAPVILPEKPRLDRNHDIVDATQVLVGCPRSDREHLRSGTWATVRYARKVGRPVILIYPDGAYWVWNPTLRG